MYKFCININVQVGRQHIVDHENEWKMTQGELDEDSLGSHMNDSTDESDKANI